MDDLRYNQATRNELLARLLSETTLNDDMGAQVVQQHFLERRGEGVGIILNESEMLSDKTPVYELFGEELTLNNFCRQISARRKGIVKAIVMRKKKTIYLANPYGFSEQQRETLLPTLVKALEAVGLESMGAV